MNKCIILSVQPQWLHKIITGKKTIEIRKSMPKDCEYPIDVYLYCTKNKPYLYESLEELWWWNDGVLEPFGDKYGVRLSDFELPKKFHDSESRGWNKLLNGFIVAKFTLNKVDRINNYGSCFEIANESYAYTNSIGNRSCLDFNDMKKYLNDKNGYAWHIDNLEIFKKPMELSEFYRNNYQVIQDYESCNNYDCIYTVNNSILGDDGYCPVDECPKLRISRPFQSWGYAYKE